GRILRMQFQRGQKVLLAKKMPHDKRRTRIMTKLFAFVDGADGGEIGLQQFQRWLLDLPFLHRIHAAVDATCPFAGLPSLDTFQVIEADARMGVDDAKGLILALQIFDKTGHDDVLDDIRKISGVIGVTIIHGCACFMSACFRQEGGVGKAKTPQYPCYHKCDIQRSTSAPTHESSPEMSGGVLLIVLFGAFLHASWNAIVKGSGDKFFSAASVTGAAGLIALVVLPFLPLPNPASWIYMLLSTVTQTFYMSLVAA